MSGGGPIRRRRLFLRPSLAAAPPKKGRKEEVKGEEERDFFCLARFSFPPCSFPYLPTSLSLYPPTYSALAHTLLPCVVTMFLYNLLHSSLARPKKEKKRIPPSPVSPFLRDPLLYLYPLTHSPRWLLSPEHDPPWTSIFFLYFQPVPLSFRGLCAAPPDSEQRGEVSLAGGPKQEVRGRKDKKPPKCGAPRDKTGKGILQASSRS